VEPALAMSVNLSPRQLSDPNLPAVIRRVLEETGVPPHCLRLELTESALIAERESARKALAEIQSIGVGFELDDFGTGYSSLSYLSLLRFDALKIDRSFVGRLEADPECRVIIRTIMAMARELGMQIIAEGIETEEQIRILREMGCELGQVDALLLRRAAAGH
jgi:EAL domain-containing protein (putative c-di-GMP-specific phosphodiesterase class I)